MRLLSVVKLVHCVIHLGANAVFSTSRSRLGRLHKSHIILTLAYFLETACFEKRNVQPLHVHGKPYVLCSAV